MLEELPFFKRICLMNTWMCSSPKPAAPSPPESLRSKWGSRPEAAYVSLPPAPGPGFGSCRPVSQSEAKHSGTPLNQNEPKQPHLLVASHHRSIRLTLAMAKTPNPMDSCVDDQKKVPISGMSRTCTPAVWKEDVRRVVKSGWSSLAQK